MNVRTEKCTLAKECMSSTIGNGLGLGCSQFIYEDHGKSVLIVSVILHEPDAPRSCDRIA